jgi:hypothetical protein
MCHIYYCEDCGDSEYDIAKKHIADLEQQVEALEKTIHNLMKPPQEI